MFESIPLAARQSMVSGWKLGLQDGDNEDKRAPKNPPAMLGSTAGTFLCLSGGVWGGVCVLEGQARHHGDPKEASIKPLGPQENLPGCDTRGADRQGQKWRKGRADVGSKNSG